MEGTSEPEAGDVSELSAASLPVNIRWIALLSYSMSMHYEYSTPKICTKSVRFHVRSKSLEMDATSSTSAYVRLVQSNT